MPHKLLLADDSVTIQRVIELTFADEDIQVIAVGDGKQAIERIQTERPDIVLADVGMPERDGYEVAAFVKGNPEFAHVPVVLLTGAFEPVDEGRARSAGCDGVLVKPFEPQMVINRVKDLLAGRRPAGLWPGITATQPMRQPAPPSDFDLKGVAQPAQGAGSNSLDDYFDRLDAVFSDSTAGGSTQAAPVPAAPPSPRSAPPAPRPPDVDLRTPRADALPGDVLADWDPDLAGDPMRTPPVPNVQVPPAPQPPAPVPVAPAAVAPAPATPLAVPQPAPPAAVPPPPSLAEAFAALLAAEQGRSIAPSSVRAEDIPQDTIEMIVGRVLERLSQQDVRSAVLDVAERLVREEIDRIKRG